MCSVSKLFFGGGGDGGKGWMKDCYLFVSFAII